ncbi:MAG: hypothetical protein ACI9T8_000082 [Candidatus Saccharimonadales bacterium]|jgi:hypothetical protein
MYATIPKYEKRDIREHLDSRAELDNFVMVEIGHHGTPIAEQQPFPFVNGRYFLGIESWMRTGNMEPISSLQGEVVNTDDQNIHFVTHVPSGRTFWDDHYGRGLLYEGPYDARMPLVSGFANEVFAGNVFGDPQLAFDSVINLVSEVGRLTSPSGVIVARETYTPQYADILKANYLAERTGVEAIGIVCPETEGWDMLENTYEHPKNRTGAKPNPGSNYIFMRPVV